MEDEKPKVGKSRGNMGMGRPKGSKNKVSASLRDSILEAASIAGGNGGTVGYLTLQAIENPGAFMTLLGKILPSQIDGPGKDGAHVLRLEADATFADIIGRIESLAARATGGGDGTA